MHNKKSLTKIVSEKFSEIKKAYSPKLRNAVFDARVRVAYLQESLKGIVPKANKENIRNIAFNLFTIPALAITYSVSALASESINVKDYIKDKFPSVFNIYLSSLEELDQYEKEFIDILQYLPEGIQKVYAKDVYDNGFTTGLLEKIKQEQTAEKPVTIDDKITTEPENPVDIYAVIASGDYYKKESYRTTCMIMFYELLRKNDVSDANIKLLMANPHNEDFTHAITYEKYKKGSLSEYLPSNKEQIEVDDNNVTLKKFLKEVSKIPSDNNDLVYIFYSSHGSEDGEFQFPGGYLDSKLLIRNIKKIDYGKLIIMQESCYAEKLVRNLKAINNCVTIAAGGKNEITNAGILSYMLVKYYNKNPNVSVRELIDNTNKELSRIGQSKFKLFCSNEKYYNEPLIPNNYLTQ